MQEMDKQAYHISPTSTDHLGQKTDHLQPIYTYSMLSEEMRVENDEFSVSVPHSPAKNVVKIVQIAKFTNSSGHRSAKSCRYKIPKAGWYSSLNVPPTTH